MFQSPHPDECRQALRAAAAKRARADQARVEATAELAEWCVKAQPVLSIAEIARVAGVTRQTVYDLIEAHGA